MCQFDCDEPSFAVGSEEKSSRHRMRCVDVHNMFFRAMFCLPSEHPVSTEQVRSRDVFTMCIAK